ncbi:dTDP-4-dehydrorhamnose reductase [uncultured Roseobacter sp.]|uniref:dTDP-4-dehydrorhamnose reductase n=1 Tax=uncultured Roseobacter sp. TaxID=114847 RepID=UPI0026176DB7|nr:dTDP-4-dehydrorhamnose reductase [uncultured Roseobacter sp.]
MKVLVFGKTGQVATELARFDGVTCLGRDQADLTDPGACEAVIADTDADAVINAAAYTAVDRAEDDRDTAMIVNAMAPTAMAAAAAARGLPFVHISTDYVFDGSGDRPWQPGDATGPLGVYGASKLGGERGVAGAGGIHAILRTSWVFSAHGANFVKTMLRLGAERDALSIVADQIGGPTPARDIAAAAMQMAGALRGDKELFGTYHFAGAPAVSWADFAREIFALAGLDVVVTDIPTADYPTPAARPLNSRLDCSATTRAFGLAAPDWRAGLADVISELNRA